MYIHHLLLLSLRDLLARKGRTALLVLGVVAGTGSLAFLLALRGGLENLVTARLDDLRAAAEKREALLDRKEKLLRALPVNRLTFRPRTGGKEHITADDLESIREQPGVKTASAVEFLFPVTLGIRAEGLAIEVYTQRVPLLEREVTTFVPVYGIPPGYVAASDLLAGKKFEEPAEGRPVPVVIPAGWLDYVTTVKDPATRERFAEVFTRRLGERLRDPRSKGMVDRITKELGSGILVESVMKDAVERALGNLLDHVTPESLPGLLALKLYPGVDPGSAPRALEIVGYSDRVPTGGISVPAACVEGWNRLFAEETAGLLDRVLSREREVLVSEVQVVTDGFEGTLAAHELLVAAGFKVESAVDDMRPILTALAASEAEADRLKSEAARIEDLGAALGRGTALLSPLLFLLGGAVVANGLALSVVEQKRRIGILRAVGARRVDILLVFLQEAFAVGAAGAGIGLGCAVAACGVLGPRLLAGVVLSGTAAPPELHLEPAAAAAVAGLSIVVSLGAGFFPALRAAWVQPIEALR